MRERECHSSVSFMYTDTSGAPYTGSRKLYVSTKHSRKRMRVFDAARKCTVSTCNTWSTGIFCRAHHPTFQTADSGCEVAENIRHFLTAVDTAPRLVEKARAVLLMFEYMTVNQGFTFAYPRFLYTVAKKVDELSKKMGPWFRVRYGFFIDPANEFAPQVAPLRIRSHQGTLPKVTE